VSPPNKPRLPLTHTRTAAVIEPDTDFRSPNFPYARQDKKDKVRHNAATRREWALC
jgi:hypothetical protein